MIFKDNKGRKGYQDEAWDERGKSPWLRSFGEFVLEILKVVVISLAIIIPVRYFLIQPFYVKGASMEPNFYDHQYLIVDEITYRLRNPQRGDIIVFKYPKDPTQYFIKRIIGLPGEKVEIKNNQVYIYNKENSQGKALTEEYLTPGIAIAPDETLQLSGDDYFVMGDNRTSSMDSRNFGPVPGKYIIGRTWLRGWPLSQISLFSTPDYGL